ncbi:MAG: MFS transporter [Bacilli bacterium]|nr:MFS transporter [Bacilli bacterium]MBN2696017.1 MFS transporter [Bacilli bacterium]
MANKSLSKKLAFASADVFGGGSFNIINFLLPGFLALTVGITPFWISFIMLTARGWDAISDPIMGYISDHTKSRFGKRRIYLIVASPLIVLGMFLLFFPYAFSSQFLRVVAVLLSYIIFTTVQTAVMIPYYSLSSEISSDYQERASFNSMRLGFSIFASIICVAVPGIIVSLFDDSGTGYQVMSLSFGVLFGLSVLITGLFTREEISTPVVSSTFSMKSMAKPLSLKPFRQYLGMFLFLQMSMAIMSGLFFFYVDFYIAKDITEAGNSNMIGMIAAAIMFSMQIVALPVYLKMIEKRSKTYAYRFGAFLWILAGFGLFFIPANVNPIIIYVLGAVMGFGISGPGLAPHTMYGDVVDAGQLKFKDRLDGQMSGFTNFINKVSQALGLSLVMFIIGLAHFESQDLTKPPIDSQPDSAMLAIRIIMALTPLIFMGIGILISYKYKIDAAKQKEITEAIHQDIRLQEQVLETL